MSFVKRAVKKVFKTVKKVVKKTIGFAKRVVKSDWFKVAAVVALSFFTVGLATGGFAMGTAGGLTGFFQGVGATIAEGFTTVTGMVAKAGSAIGNMFGAGATETAAATGAETAIGFNAATATEAATLAEVGLTESAQAGFLAGGTASASQISALSMAELSGLAATGAAPAGSTGFLSTLGHGLKSLTPKSTVGKILAFQAISGGIENYYKQRELDKQEGYYRNRTFWGKAAYGSDGQGIGLLQPDFGGDKLAEQDPTTAAGGAAQGLLPFEQQQLADQQFAKAQQAQEAPFQQAGGMGVPGEQTQPPPATQPQDPNAPPPTPGSQLENIGLLA